MGTSHRFTRQLVDGGREALGEPAVVDEDQRGPMPLNELEQLRVNR